MAGIHARHTEQRRKFISEAFHSFNQPLTNLHCGLEITLLKSKGERDYRKRVAEALEQAGAIFKLNKALRELADAVDPGERYGMVELQPLLEQFRDELLLVAGPSGIKIAVECQKGTSIAADPSKFLRCLGALATNLIAEHGPESILKLDAESGNGLAKIKMQVGGKPAPEPISRDLDGRVREIQRDAAYSYIWALDGDFEVKRNGIEITVPAKGIGLGVS